MRFDSLKSKLSLGALGLAVLFMGLQFLFQTHSIQNDLRHRIAHEQFVLLTELAGQLDDKLLERQKALTAVGQGLDFRQIHQTNTLEQFLKQQVALLTLFDDLYIFDAKGVLLVDWPIKPGRRQLDMSSRDYIQGVQQTLKPYISQPILGKATKQPIVVLATPVLDEHGTLVAIMGGVLNLYRPNLIGALPERKIGEEGYHYLVSDQKVIISHPDRTRIMQPTPTPEQNPSLAKAFEGFEGTLEGVNSKGMHGLFTFKRMHTTGWILGSTIPTTEAFSPVDRLKREQSLIAAALLGMALVLLWLFSRSLLRPLDTLVLEVEHRTRDLSSGEALPPVPEPREQEFRQLVAAFNQFLAARNQAAQQVQAHERKQLEYIRELAEARDKAQDANLAKSQFLANMSHELRTPLNGIIGMGQLMHMDSTLSTESREMTETILNSGRSLLCILNDILDASKIEAGKMTLQPQAFDPRGVVHDILALMHPLTVEKSLHLTHEISADCPELLWGDPLRIRQILTNLMGNAIKFTESGSVHLHLSVAPRDDTRVDVTFTVQDTGIGIPESQLEAIFQPFTQADNSNTRAYGGTGLGLSISRHLTELMDGTLTVDSTLGKGSHFQLRLPLHRVDSQQP